MSTGLRSSNSTARRARLSAFERLSRMRRPALGHGEQVDLRQPDVGWRVGRVEFDGALEQGARLGVARPDHTGKHVPPAQNKVIGFQIVRGLGR